jgi:predicted enzyme related to lactoylglutathione lyase
MSAPQNVAVWFEIPAANFERAVGFYEKVFETKLKRDTFASSEMAIFPYEGNGVSGCVMKGDGYKPTREGSVVYLTAGKDLSGPLARAAANGGAVAIPKTQLPEGMGYFAQFIDIEGNRVGLHSMG